MTGWLRLALATQLLVFGAWGGQLLTSHRDAPTVWLETEPVDPRDLLSGHYVALRFPVGSPRGDGCYAPGAGSPPVFVQVVPSGRTVDTRQGAVEVWEVSRCSDTPPPATTDERWIRGRWVRSTVRSVAFGIERFYVSETSTLRTLQSGQVVAKVAINDAHRARIQALVEHHPTSAATR